MSVKMVHKEFKLVALKGSGEFVNFGYEVPLLAKQLLSRSKEILHSTGTEIAVFEPKKDETHKIGHYYAGLIVSEKCSEVPSGMHYIETNKSYLTARGDIAQLEQLHTHLLNWGEQHGYQRDLDSYIIETYHPAGEGEEEVQIYLPIHL